MKKPAEWINPARAALAIRSIGSDSVFELRGAKRGKRLRWKDADGNPTNVQHIAHHGEPGVICWRQADPDEVAELLDDTGRPGRPRKYDEFECVHAVIHCPGESQSFYLDQIAETLGCGKETARMMIKTCTAERWIKERGDHRFRRYEVTELGREKAQNRPSAHDWPNRKPETPENDFLG